MASRPALASSHRFSLADIRKDYTVAAKNPEVVSHFEELLDDWCRQIEKYLETSLDRGAAQADTGPRSEARGSAQKPELPLTETWTRAVFDSCYEEG